MERGIGRLHLLNMLKTCHKYDIISEMEMPHIHNSQSPLFKDEKPSKIICTYIMSNLIYTLFRRQFKNCGVCKADFDKRSRSRVESFLRRIITENKLGERRDKIDTSS